MLTKIKLTVYKKPELFISLLIFFTCIFIYLSNGKVITSNDNIPNSLLAFNWLENGTLDLDAFRGGHFYGPDGACLRCPDSTPYFFSEAPNGHLTSTYPIGTALVTFPIYFVFFIFLKFLALLQTVIPSLSFDIPTVTDADFETYRKGCEKLAATFCIALSVVIFYLSVRLKFNRAVAIATTFIYAFANLTWVIGSQGLRQHTATLLVLSALLLCLLKVNRAEGRNRKTLLLLAGILCGFLPGIRPTNLVFVLAAVVYSAFTYRREAVFLLLGLPSVLLSAGWNFYFFGFSPSNFLVGGYSRMFEDGPSSYNLTLKYFTDAFGGLLISPSRGLLTFSPVLLFAIPGAYRVFKFKSGRDEKLLACLAIACLILFFQYCFYVPWWGAISYGSRFLADILPVLCYLICYYVASQFEKLWGQKKRLSTGIFVVFLTCLLFSTFVETVGAFGNFPTWEPAPLWNPARVWDVRDSQIERQTKSVFYKLTKPIQNSKVYARQFDGVIEGIKNNKNRLINKRIIIPAGKRESRILRADLRNTGQVQWFGYQTGMVKGEARVRVRFLNRRGKQVSVPRNDRLYVSGMPKPGETAQALGRIDFPSKPGNYQMLFELIPERLDTPPGMLQRSPYVLEARVEARSTP